MDCHYKEGDVILLSDREAVQQILNKECTIEQGVIFRFYYEESDSEIESVPELENKAIKQEVKKVATTSKETKQMPEVPVDLSSQESLPDEVSSPVVETASTVQQDAPFDLNQILTTTGGGGGFAIILAIIAILGGGAAWKFYQKFSEQKHEQKMKELELQAQSQGLNGAQPPPCQAANAAIEAKLVAMEGKIASVEKKTSSFSAAFDADEVEERIIKLEKKVKILSSKSI